MSHDMPDDAPLWVVHIGNDDATALRALRDGFICIGWTEMGDLTPHDTRDKMKAAMRAAYPQWSDKKLYSSYGQTYRFAHEMAQGDPVVFPVRPTGEIAIGKVAGPYERRDADPALAAADYTNVRPVQWIAQLPRTSFSQAALHSFGSFSSISRSDDFLDEVRALLRDASATPRHRPTVEPAEDVEAEDTATDLYESAYQETEDFLLKAWRRTGSKFEAVVAGVLESLGYTATVTPPSGDHGVDVIAHPDPLGLKEPFIKVQVKSGTSTVGEPDVNQLRGLLLPGEEGILISLGKFSSGAYAIERASTNVKLIGPRDFVRLFLDHYENLDPVWRARYPLKRLYVPVAGVRSDGS